MLYMFNTTLQYSNNSNYKKKLYEETCTLTVVVLFRILSVYQRSKETGSKTTT